MQFKEILEGVDVWTVVLWIGLLVAVFFILWRGFPWLRRFVAFVNDVSGEPARPGREALPGIMERIARIEETQHHNAEVTQDISNKVNTVHHEVFPNSGKSLRDQTNRIEAKVSKDYKEITSLKKQMSELSTDVKSQQEELTKHIEVSTGILNTLKKESS